MDVEKLSFVSVSDKKFVQQDVSLDGMRFLRCSFDRCNLLYSGGPVVMDTCLFQNCEWKMQGTAAIVLYALQTCGWHITPPKSEVIQ